MENYKQASKVGQDLILTYFSDRMKSKKINKEQLAEILEISVTTLWRYFKKKSPMPLSVYLEICAALEVRPYLIPTESDNTEMKQMFLN
jgi:DNA-binding Xre family transcriptional regulator